VYVVAQLLVVFGGRDALLPGMYKNSTRGGQILTLVVYGTISLCLLGMVLAWGFDRA
jgi:hypothetical protein